MMEIDSNDIKEALELVSELLAAHTAALNLIAKKVGITKEQVSQEIRRIEEAE